MPARLVQLDEGRRVASTTLRSDECVIGRDPTSHLILDYARVSRRHAVVRTLGERHTLADLDSSNGTRVNGHAVGSEPVLLQPGDEIEVAETVSLIYESGSESRTRIWLVAAGAALLVLALAIGLALWRPSGVSDDPDLIQAAQLARQGRQAFEQGDSSTAKERLQAAAGILFKAGYLDDVPRADVMEVAMDRLARQMGERVNLWRIFQESLHAAAPPIPQPESDREAEVGVGCRLDRVPASQIRPCVHERVELILIELRQDPTGIPPDFADEVGRRILYEYDLIHEALERGEDYIPMLRTELENARMPPLLHYLALIESGYRADARSPARAVGMWQFMPGTARQYGMRVTDRRDDRRDPKKSTHAAARYLRDLAFEFGGDALLLALASYNRGENGVRRALKKLDDPFSDRSYWKLVDEGLLPVETSRYVTRFVAAAVAGEAGLPAREDLERAGF
ncbi:MAG: transglycosylase SLT domain-containing protein [Myxococcota bacterium]